MQAKTSHLAPVRFFMRTRQLARLLVHKQLAASLRKKLTAAPTREGTLDKRLPASSRTVLAAPAPAWSASVR